MTITAENLRWKTGSKTILDQVSLEVRPGETLGLLGPNGSGKTSLLRLLAGLKRPTSGKVQLDGRDLNSYGRKALAQRIAFVEQHAATNASLKAVDVVRLGRFPHRSMFSGWSERDETAVEAALQQVGMTDKRHDSWQNLSGGEKQRVHIARAIAQSPRELILDEPTNHLDIEHQIGLLRLIADLPLTSIIAMHDLNHAAMFCDRLVILKQGRVAAAGTPQQVLSRDFLRDIFGVDAHVEPSAFHGRPHIHYLR